jgi:sulfur carrier protein
MALTLILNGQSRLFADLSAGSALADLIAALELKQDRVALEHNGEIASRTTWQSTEINEGDRIELVHFVGGGSTT